VRPNWFLAFPVDGSFTLALPEVPAGLRRYHPQDVHLTLAFLGGCGEAGAERALLTLDELLAQSNQRPIQISLGQVAQMGPPRAYSALSALLNRGREETEACIGRLRDALIDSASGKREKREPKAHVTLARPARRATAAERAAGLAWANELDLRSVHLTLDRVALYTWHETRAERLFRTVAERKLA
jgi:2'-5' RNA ligase